MEVVHYQMLEHTSNHDNHNTYVRVYSVNQTKYVQLYK